MSERSLDDKALNRIIGDKIRGVRQSRGQTLAHVAHRLKISMQQLQKYETGQSRISVVALCHMARVLDKRPAYFLETPEFNDKFGPVPRDDAQSKHIAMMIDRILDNDIRNSLYELLRNISR